MKKNLAKQIFVIAVGVIIAVVAVLFSSDFNQAKGGAGLGKNTKIQSMEEAAILFSSFQKQLSGYNIADEFEADNLQTNAEYSSVTLSVVSNGKIGLEVNGGPQDIKFDRNMTVYLTEKASYYIVDFRIAAYARVNSSYTQSYISGKIRIYIEKEFAMLRIDRADSIWFDIIDSLKDGGVNKNNSSVLGKWIYVSSDDGDYNDIVNELTSVNDSNFDVLSLMGKYINNQSYFEQNGSYYELREEYIKSFINDIIKAQFGTSFYSFDEEADKAAFTVDLRNATSPECTLSFNIELPKVYSASEVDIMTFENINNTVIKAPNIKNAISFEEFMALMED